jgi:hypothetical protein
MVTWPLEYESVPLPTTAELPSWPAVSDVVSVLGLPAGTTSDVLEAATAAAADMVRIDTGWTDSDPVSVPPALWSAALLAAVVTLKAPEAPHGIASVFDVGALHVARDHPTYRRLLRGMRRGSAFGVA